MRRELGSGSSGLNGEWSRSTTRSGRGRLRGWLLPGALVVLAAGLSGASTYAYYRYLPPGRALTGTYVGGRLQPPDKALGVWLEERRLSLLSRPVYLEVDGEVFERRLGQLGVELDVAATLARVRNHAEQGSISERMYRVVAASRGEEDLDLVWSVDPRKASAALEALAPDVLRDPVDARLDLAAHEKIHDTPGRTLDVDKTLAVLEESSAFDENQIIGVQTRAVAPQVTLDMLADIDVTQVLGSFETKFAGTGEGRAVNVKRGAAYLNGTVIAPGQVLSFNEQVGARTLERGFTWAPVILDDELTPGVGGGTCQVSSTLHAAAVYGGLDIVDRRSHSRPSSYAPLGLDATVVWGAVDLKIRNSYDTPVIIHAFVPTPGMLRVEILGRQAPKVDYSYAISRASDFYRRVTTKPWLKDGKRIVRQRGRKGYEVVSLVKITSPEGRVTEKRYNSGYRPVPEVFWVGPGHDLDTLPELPAGAKNVEVDGRELPGELFGASPFDSAAPSG